eukprot:4187853-Prymnesium_polylepis.1
MQRARRAVLPATWAAARRTCCRAGCGWGVEAAHCWAVPMDGASRAAARATRPAAATARADARAMVCCVIRRSHSCSRASGRERA